MSCRYSSAVPVTGRPIFFDGGDACSTTDSWREKTVNGYLSPLLFLLLLEPLLRLWLLRPESSDEEPPELSALLLPWRSSVAVREEDSPLALAEFLLGWASDSAADWLRDCVRESVRGSARDSVRVEAAGVGWLGPAVG